MFDLLNTVNAITTNILVLTGVFVIVNSVIQSFTIARSEEANSYSWQEKLLSGMRLVVKNILIALPLFIVKFLHDMVREDRY